MSKIYKLKNGIKNYEWGSQSLIPQLLGLENNDASPFAEMWMGTHKGAPSQVFTDSDEQINLSDICGDIPFLFKLIAVEKPLSIQAHPNKEQAEEGFRKEEAAGIGLKTLSRNYKDSNHKPEIICAITPITLMTGFKEPEEIINSLDEFLSLAPMLGDIIAPLVNVLKSGTLSRFFRVLFNFTRLEQEYLCSFINKKDDSQKCSYINDEQWKLMKKFASFYPGDPAILSPLYLNALTLNPGQAIYVPAGVLHAYISGFGVELMTSSDNVLRGGLTSKHVDVEELMKILKFVPYYPQVIVPSASAKWFFYHTPCREFLLVKIDGDGELIFPGNGPAICIITEGSLNIGEMSFKKGESFFIPESNEPVLFNGSYSLFAACLTARNLP
jgi:mannose-6-phosphate isomerase